MLEKIFKQYGTAVILHHGEQVYPLRAFFTPVSSRSWQNMEHQYGPLGEIPRGQYTYIGPVDIPAEMGDVVEVGKRQYLFRRLETVYDHDGPIYCWGLCVENGGPDTWGS